MSEIKLLSFDLDDTLWPCYPTIQAAEKLLYQWLSVNVPLLTEQYSIDEIAVKRIRFMKNHPEMQHDLSRCRIESLRDLASEANVVEGWVEDAFQVYYEARQKVTLYEDTDVLDHLQEEYRLVAVTNGNSDIHKTGVAHWFEFSVSAAEVGQMKPHPDIFMKVLERAQLSCDEVLHIGDDGHHDVFGASQSGIRSVWLNREGGEWQHNDWEADYHIQSLVELPVILNNLRA